MTIILRDDQAKLKNDIYNGWNAGNRNMLAVLPTGGGKSIIVSDIAYDRHLLGMKQSIIAHRQELIGQMSLHIARRGIEHQIIGPNSIIGHIRNLHREELGYNFVNPSAKCSVVGIDTLNARVDILKEWAIQQDAWTIDEAHHVLLNNKWGRGVELFRNAVGLGVTATPRRADGMGLGIHHDGVFNAMVLGPSSRELMNIGAITEYELVIPQSDFEIDEGDLPPSGDFTTKKMREASKSSHIVGDVVKEYVRHAFGKRAICFATDVETAKEIAQQFKDAGIPAAAISAKTPDALRDDYIKRFKRGEFWILVNVDLFGEGFDVPAVEVVIMARPTASLAVYLQQAGRALRAFPGKLFGLIIDHVSNYKRHGYPDKHQFWTLDRRDKRAKQERDPEEIELTVCRNCSRPYERVFACCPRCGWSPAIEPRERSSIERIDGDLILLDRAKLAEMRAATQLEAPASVAMRVGEAVGKLAGLGAANKQIERIQSQQKLSETIAYWAGYQRSLGRDDQQSYRRFYLTTGVDVLTALSLPRVEMDKLTATIQGWKQ